MTASRQWVHLKVRKSLDSDIAYADEPLAEEWIKQNEKEKKENKELERMLEKGLHGMEWVDSW